MQINNLYLENVRNLSAVKLACHPSLNVFLGPNGVGKTALLESIFLLSSGKSFRTHCINQVISFEAPHLLVSAALLSQEHAFRDRFSLGIQRFHSGESRLFLSEHEKPSLGDLAKALPVQLVNHDSFDLLIRGPEVRRSFLDWGVFHVEPDFLSAWRGYQRALKQRNAALKKWRGQQAEKAAICVWDQQLAATGEVIQKTRLNYLKIFCRQVALVFEMLFAQTHLGQYFRHVKVVYLPGWREALSLREALNEHFDRDCLFRHTRVGPHRADLLFYIDGILAKEVLSRGQIKLFAIGLLLARARVLLEVLSRKSIFLLDDLSAELDSISAQGVLKSLEALDAQVFLSGIDEKTLEKIIGDLPYKLFHVEQLDILRNKAKEKEVESHAETPS